MKEVPLWGRKGVIRAFALVDDDDAWVLEHRWYLAANGYAMANRLGKRNGGALYLHRLILDAPSGVEVDHRNRDRLDCQRENLRLATRRQNGQNLSAHRDGASGSRGVWQAENGRWRAGICVDGKTIYLGRFDTIADAEAAVRKARAERMPFSEEAA